MALTLRVEVTKNDAGSALDRVKVGMNAAARRVIRKVLEDARGRISQAAPTRTGELARSFVVSVTTVRRPLGVIGLVGTDDPKARFLEFGTSRGIRGRRFVLEAFTAATEGLQAKFLKEFGSL